MTDEELLTHRVHGVALREKAAAAYEGDLTGVVITVTMVNAQPWMTFRDAGGALAAVFRGSFSAKPFVKRMKRWPKALDAAA